MRNLIIAVTMTAAVAAAGALGWRAEAANPAAPVPAVPQAAPYTPIHPAACEGRSIDCPPGRHRICGPDGRTCWCKPC